MKEKSQVSMAFCDFLFFSFKGPCLFFKDLILFFKRLVLFEE